MNIRPYRPDSPLSRQRLHMHFHERLGAWNTACAHTPITGTVEPVGTPPALEVTPWDTRLLLDAHCLPLVRLAAFGQTHTAFDAPARLLQKRLVDTLLEPAPAPPLTAGIEDWFYPGSPAICLRLTCGHLQTTLYPHPLLLADLLATPVLPTLLKVVPNPPLNLEVRIENILLPLAALRDLRPGDIIRTDTAIDAAVSITHGGHSLGHAAYGTCDGHPSIQLLRSTS